MSVSRRSIFRLFGAGATVAAGAISVKATPTPVAKTVYVPPSSVSESARAFVASPVRGEVRAFFSHFNTGDQFAHSHTFTTGEYASHTHTLTVAQLPPYQHMGIFPHQSTVPARAMTQLHVFDGANWIPLDTPEGLAVARNV